MTSPYLKYGLVALLLAILAIGAVVSLTQPPDPNEPRKLSRKVDHYLLSLGWSPSYCLESGKDADPRQCGNGKSFGFIVQGLWPQTATGPLRNCDSNEPRVPDSIVDDMRTIMPSARLVGNQWRKHGTCTGLTQEDYFDLVRRAYQRINVPIQFNQAREVKVVSPRDVERAFLEANKGLSPDMLAVTCTERNVREVRVCLGTDLTFRSCKGARNECTASEVAMPPAQVVTAPAPVQAQTPDHDDSSVSIDPDVSVPGDAVPSD